MRRGTSWKPSIFVAESMYGFVCVFTDPLSLALFRISNQALPAPSQVDENTAWLWLRDRIPRVELRISWLMPYLLVAVVRIIFMMCVVNVTLATAADSDSCLKREGRVFPRSTVFLGRCWVFYMCHWYLVELRQHSVETFVHSNNQEIERSSWLRHTTHNCLAIWVWTNCFLYSLAIVVASCSWERGWFKSVGADGSSQ